MIRKLTLATAIAILAALPLPMWNATRNLVTRPSLPAVVWIAIVVAYLCAAILPLFYFAMWRVGGDIVVPRRLRRLCLIGALCGVIVIGTQIPVTTVATLLSMLATLSCAALLIAMFRQSREIGHTSAYLRRMSRVAVIGGGLWLAINVLALIRDPNPGRVRTLLEQACFFTPPLVAGFR